MIIKSISHSSSQANVRNLIAYIFGDSNMERNGRSITIHSNLIGKRDSWAQQYERIEQRRTSFYAGRESRLMHEILSFSTGGPKPTHEELEHLMWKYLELRIDSPTLAFGGVHFSDNVHAHFCIQSIDMFGASIRKSKADFRAIQIRMNEYMLEHFPHLKASYVDYGKASKEAHRRHSHKSEQRAKRTHQKTKKERAYDLIQTAFVDSSSIEAFVANLALKDIEVYYRREKLIGIIFEHQKMRLKQALGIDFELLLKPDLNQERLVRIKKLKDSRNTNKSKER